MKHEGKSVSKIGGVIILFIFLVTLIGCVVLQTPILNMLIGSDKASALVTMISIMAAVSFFIYVLLLVGAIYGILIYLGTHFHKSMYGQEGYLTQTLPVNTHQLLGGKILVSSLWMLLVVLSVIISVLLLGFFMAFGVARIDNPDLTLF